MQATHVLDFPEIYSPERTTKMGRAPATRWDSWAQTLALLVVLGTIGGFVLAGEHRLTVIETNTTSQTRLAESAATASREAYEIARLSARGTLLLLEVVQNTPAAKLKKVEIQEVMSQLKNKRVSENTMPDFAGGGPSGVPSGINQ